MESVLMFVGYGFFIPPWHRFKRNCNNNKDHMDSIVVSDRREIKKTGDLARFYSYFLYFRNEITFHSE